MQGDADRDDRGESSPPDDDLDFELEPDEAGGGRSELLYSAAHELDDYGGDLAPGKQRTTAAADWALEFDQDQAALAEPQVLKLDLSKLSNDAPVRKSELLKRWHFYWVSFPLSLYSRPGRGFNRLEFKAAFNENDDEHTRPRTHDALPTQQFAELAQARGSLKVGVGGHLNFAVEPPSVDLNAAGIPIKIQAGVRAAGALDTSMVLGPFEYSIRVPRVQRSNLELDTVRWRLEGSRMVQESDPGLRVVLRVPKDTAHLHVTATLRARRYVETLDGTFMEAVSGMSEKVAYFFKRGAPIGDRRQWNWDLTTQL